MSWLVCPAHGDRRFRFHRARCIRSEACCLDWCLFGEAPSAMVCPGLRPNLPADVRRVCLESPASSAWLPRLRRENAPANTTMFRDKCVCDLRRWPRRYDLPAIVQWIVRICLHRGSNTVARSGSSYPPARRCAWFRLTHTDHRPRRSRWSLSTMPRAPSLTTGCCANTSRVHLHGWVVPRIPRRTLVRRHHWREEKPRSTGFSKKSIVQARIHCKQSVDIRV